MGTGAAGILVGHFRSSLTYSDNRFLTGAEPAPWGRDRKSAGNRVFLPESHVYDHGVLAPELILRGLRFIHANSALPGVSTWVLVLRGAGGRDLAALSLHLAPQTGNNEEEDQGADPEGAWFRNRRSRYTELICEVQSRRSPSTVYARGGLRDG